MCLMLCGSYTKQAYLRSGLTKDLYTCSLTDLAAIFRTRLSSPRVLLSLLVTALMWASQVMSKISETPKFLV